MEDTKKPRKIKRWHIVIIVIAAFIATMVLYDMMLDWRPSKSYETIEQAIEAETHVSEGETIEYEIVDNFYVGAVFSNDSFHTFAGVITDEGYRPLTGEYMEKNTTSERTQGKARCFDYGGNTLVCFAASGHEYELVGDKNPDAYGIKNTYGIIESEDKMLQFVYHVYKNEELPEIIEVREKQRSGWEEIRSIYT